MQAQLGSACSVKLTACTPWRSGGLAAIARSVRPAITGQWALLWFCFFCGAMQHQKLPVATGPAIFCTWLPGLLHSAGCAGIAGSRKDGGLPPCPPAEQPLSHDGVVVVVLSPDD